MSKQSREVRSGDQKKKNCSSALLQTASHQVRLAPSRTGPEHGTLRKKTPAVTASALSRGFATRASLEGVITSPRPAARIASTASSTRACASVRRLHGALVRQTPPRREPRVDACDVWKSASSSSSSSSSSSTLVHSLGAPCSSRPASRVLRRVEDAGIAVARRRARRGGGDVRLVPRGGGPEAQEGPARGVAHRFEDAPLDSGLTASPRRQTSRARFASPSRRTSASAQAASTRRSARAVQDKRPNASVASR